MSPFYKLLLSILLVPIVHSLTVAQTQELAPYVHYNARVSLVSAREEVNSTFNSLPCRNRATCTTLNRVRVAFYNGNTLLAVAGPQEGSPASVSLSQPATRIVIQSQEIKTVDWDLNGEPQYDVTRNPSDGPAIQDAGAVPRYNAVFQVSATQPTAVGAVFDIQVTDEPELNGGLSVNRCLVSVPALADRYIGGSYEYRVVDGNGVALTTQVAGNGASAMNLSLNGMTLIGGNTYYVQLNHGLNGTSYLTRFPFTAVAPISLDSIKAKLPVCPGGEGQINVKGVRGGNNWGYRAAVVTANATEPADDAYIPVSTSFSIQRPGGVYDLWIKDSSGCPGQKMATGVQIGAAIPLATALVDTVQAFCSGIASGKIAFTLAGGDGAHYEYSYNGSEFSDVPLAAGRWELAGLAAGVHRVIFRAEGCTTEQSFTHRLGIAQGEPGVDDEDIVQPNCPGTTGSASYTLTGGSTYGYEYALDNNGFQRAVVTNGRWTGQGLTSGGHVLKFRIAGCQEEVLNAVVIDAVPEAITAIAVATVKSGTTHIMCYGGNDGEIIISDLSGGTAPGGFADYSVSLTKDGIFFNGSSDGAAEKFTYRNLVAGNYTVGIGDKHGCVEQLPVVVAEPDLVTIQSVVKTDEGCLGAHDGKIEASFAGGTGSYTARLWAKGNERTDIYMHETLLVNAAHVTYEGIAPGEYLVGVKDSNGCPDTWRVSGIVTIGAAASALVFTYDAIAADSRLFVQCKNDSNGSVKAMASGGWGDYSFSLNGTDYTEDNEIHIFSGLAAGEQSFYVKDALGCVVQFQLTVAEPATALSLDVTGIQPHCAGGYDGEISLQAAGGWGGYSFSPDGSVYTGAAADQYSFSGFRAGNYIVYVKDARGCVQPAALTLTDRPALAASLTDTQDITCFGRATGSIAVTATGGTQPYHATALNTVTGSLFDSEDAERFNGLPAGDYVVTVRDDLGCEKEIQAVIVQPGALTIAVDNVVSPTACGLSDGLIDVTLSGGSAQFERSWYRDNDLLSGDEDLLDIPSGTYRLVIADRNDLTCTTEKAIGVSDRTALAIAVNNIKPVTCLNGSDGAASVDITGADGAYTIAWSNGGAAESISGVPAGAYVVRVRDSGNCVATQDVEIGTLPMLTITASIINPSCPARRDGEIGVTLSNVQGSAQLTWNDGHPGEMTRKDLKQGQYVVRVRDVAGCTASQALVLRDPDPVSIRAVSQSVLSCYNDCNGEIQVDAQGGAGGYSYQWSSSLWGGDMREGASVAGLCAGVYRLQAMDSKGCKVTKSYTMINPLEIALLPSFTLPTCFNDQNGRILVETRSGTAPYVYTWQHEGWEDSHITTDNFIDGLNAGTYDVAVTDAAGCLKTTSLVLENPAKVEISLDDEIYLCGGESTELNAGYPGSRYRWTSDKGFSSAQQVVTISEPALYTAEVITQAGCSDQHTFRVINSNELLKARFLISSEAVVGDTVVMISVSEPAPNRLQWDVTGNPDRFQDPGSYYQEFKYYQAGEQEVTLYAYKGDCLDAVTKRIMLYESTEALNEDTSVLGYEGITLTDLRLYPNPNEGAFQVHVVFNKPMDVKLTIMPLEQQAQQLVFTGNSQTQYDFDVAMSQQTKGLHVLYLEAGKIREVIKFIVH